MLLFFCFLKKQTQKTCIVPSFYAPRSTKCVCREFHNPPIALETAEHPWVPLSRQSDEIYETSPPPSGHVKQSQASDFVRLQNSAHVACVTEKYQLFGNILQAGLQTKER